MIDTDFFQIKDQCRNNLSRYTIQAFSIIHEIEHPIILDIGCGTGVTSLALLKKCNATIYAVDPDLSCINRLKEKVSEMNLEHRIKVFNDSVFNPGLFSHKFDIVLAEGLLNVIGFETGLPLLIGHVKKNGFIIIHDELKDDDAKRNIFDNHNLKLLDSFILGKDVWWKEYYDCLEKKIRSAGKENLFKNELEEIEEYKTDPRNYTSIYYILQN